MGCDYYIRVYLEIEHTNGISYYDLSLIRCYYGDLDCGIYDSDDDVNNYYCNSREYKKLYKNMIKMCLTPRKPIVIYSNHSFTTAKLEEKYLPMIQNKINKKYVDDEEPYYQDSGTFTKIEEVIKITKKEIRYKR